MSSIWGRSLCLRHALSVTYRPKQTTSDALLEDWRYMPCCDRNRTFSTYKPDYRQLCDTDVLSTASMQHKESAMSRWPALTLFIVLAVWSELPAQVQDESSNYYPPVARLAQYDFTEGQFFKTLSAVSGTWATSAGTLNSTSATTRAIATIDSYIPQTSFHENLTEISAGKFWYRARMLNQRSGSSTRVGIVYQYQDPGNFYEVSFSPTGSVFVRDVSNGVGRTVATGTYTGGGQNKWFDVQVEWTATETISGPTAFRSFEVSNRTGARTVASE
jgi:hypothetical protein